MGKVGAAAKALKGPFKKLVHDLEESSVAPKVAKAVEGDAERSAATKAATATEKKVATTAAADAGETAAKKSASTSTKKAAVGDVDAYGAQRKIAANTGLDIDHIPSNASNIAAATARKGKELSAAEERAVKRSGASVAVPRKVHQALSETYGGRNTAAKIAQDAADPAGAIRRDFGAYRGTLEALGWSTERIEAKLLEIVNANIANGRI